MTTRYRAHRWVGPIALALAASSELSAQTMHVRLRDVMQRATRLSPDVRGERAYREIAQAQQRAAFARLLPDLSTAVTVQRNPQLNAAILPAEVFGGRGDARVVRLGTPYESGATGSLRVPLFDAAQRAAVTEGAAAMGRAEATLARAEEEIALLVTDAYVSLHVRHTEYAAAQARSEARAQQRAVAEQSAAAGRITAQHLETVRLNDMQARSRLAQAHLSVEIARDVLASLISDKIEASPIDSLVLDDSLSVLVAQTRVDDAMPAVRREDVLAVGAVRVARADEEVAAAARLRARRANWPALRLVGTVSNVAFANDARNVTVNGGRFTQSTIGLQFEPPALDLGVRRAQRDEAEAALRRARFKRDAVEREVALAERTAWRARESANLELEIAHRAVSISARTVKACEADVHGGLGTVVAVQTARADLAEAQAVLAQAMANVVLRDAEWRRLAGRTPIGAASGTALHGGAPR